MSEFTWPYQFDTSKDAWRQIRLYSAIPLIVLVLAFPRLVVNIIDPANVIDPISSLLLLLAVWFTFSFFVFSRLKPVKGTVGPTKISVDPVSFMGLPTGGDSGTFETKNYACVTVSPITFSRTQKEVTLTGRSKSNMPAIHLGIFDANEAERLAAHLSDQTGIASTDEVAATDFRESRK